MPASYDEAIEVLAMAADKSDARILNYLGYSHRKSGRIEVGLGYYQEALRNNPDYTLVARISRRGLSAARRCRIGARAADRDRKALRHGLRGIRRAVASRSTLSNKS